MKFKKHYNLLKHFYYRFVKCYYLNGSYDIKKYDKEILSYNEYINRIKRYDIIKKINLNNMRLIPYYFCSTNFYSRSIFIRFNNVFCNMLVKLYIDDLKSIMSKILKKNKVVENYINNINKFHASDVKTLDEAFSFILKKSLKTHYRLDSSLLLNQAFEWRNTAEGYFFWLNISKEYTQNIIKIRFTELFSTYKITE